MSSRGCHCRCGRADVALIAARERTVALLLTKLRRVKAAGRLGNNSTRQAAVAFNALCEGLANSELRGSTLPILPAGKEEHAWYDALNSLVRGFNEGSPPRRR